MAENRGNTGSIAQHNGVSKMNGMSWIGSWLPEAIIGHAMLNRPNIALIAMYVRIDLISDGSIESEALKEKLGK